MQSWIPSLPLLARGLEDGQPQWPSPSSLSSLLCLVCATLHLIIKQKAFDRSSKFCFFTPQGSRIPGVALLTGKPPPQGHPTASNSQVSLEPKWPCRGFCWPPFVEPKNLLQILSGCLALLPCGLWLHSWFVFVFAFGFVALRSFAFSVFRASFEKVGKFGPNFMSAPVYLTRHAFHTMYAVLRGPRRQKINSCLGVLLTSHVQFFERGFDNYLQHFVMMVVSSSRLSS